LRFSFFMELMNLIFYKQYNTFFCYHYYYYVGFNIC